MASTRNAKHVPGLGQLARHFAIRTCSRYNDPLRQTPANLVILYILFFGVEYSHHQFGFLEEEKRGIPYESFRVSYKYLEIITARTLKHRSHRGVSVAPVLHLHISSHISQDKGIT